MLLIAAPAGCRAQSYAAAAAFAAAAGASLMQYFLTGGPVAALAAVIPIVPGSDLTLANRFQRPSILAGLAWALLLSFVV